MKTNEVKASEKLVIKSEGTQSLACGFTKVKVFPKYYANILHISGLTGKTIQETVNILLEYAIRNCIVEIDDINKVDFSALIQ